MSGRDFWSRRQAAVAAEAVAEERVDAESEAAAREAEVAEQSDAEILAALELPEPESLVEGDDFKIFLTDQVPARIKTRALRHLWRANPVLARVDGLVDYGEDFTDAACVIEGLQTAYQVGKGMTKHVDELARQARLASGEVETAGEEADALTVGDSETDGETEAAPLDATSAEQMADTATGTATDSQVDSQVDSNLDSAALTPLDTDQNAAAPVAAYAAETAEITESFATAAPRRMRFSFERAQG
ncbi:DUF3306 domain-containing protein [Pseudophaeobacter leonis]|uniref:DUF3306 domain-containing protein n=1 Tax=Pseudophaeobacter leonis TaxID=1144477 RepID=UPI0009F69D36|nr:DUF3306 domain-containing protein [Pseudophaeobacter leonis]